MNPIETLGLALGAGFSSGLNLYATVATLGLLQRYSVIHLPSSLQVLSHPWVLGIAIARAAVNTSPEPFSNWILSFGEDVLAVWLTWMATAHPLATTMTVVGLVAISAVLLYYLFRFARRALRQLFSMARAAATFQLRERAVAGVGSPVPHQGRLTSFLYGSKK